MVYLRAAVAARGHREGSFSERKARSLQSHVCDLYLIEQRQTRGHPVLQFDDGNEVALLSFILARVAQRQRVILQKKRKKNTEKRRLLSRY